MAHFLSIILSMFVTFYQHVELSSNTYEQKLIDYLFANYSKSVRPVTDRKDGLTVGLGLTFIQILTVDERSQRISMKVWYRLIWKDQYLTWNATQWGGIERLLVTPEQLWVPDILLYDRIGDDVRHNHIMAFLYHNGTVYWSRPLVFTTSCHIDVTHFPFDKQTCSLMFSSWAHDVSEIRLNHSTDAFITKDYINNSEWELTNVVYNIQTVEYDMISTRYSVMTLNYMILRKPLYYLFNVLVPVIILMSLILLSFCFPPDRGERAAITITILLAYTVFLHSVNSRLPVTSDSIPVLSVFYVTIMAESAISLGATCLVLVAHQRSTDRGVVPVPKWVQTYFIDMLGRKLGVVRYPKKKPSVSMELVVADGVIKEYGQICNDIKTMNKPTWKEDWHYLGKVLDRLFLGVFLTTFLVTSMAILLPTYVIHNNYTRANAMSDLVQ